MVEVLAYLALVMIAVAGVHRAYRRCLLHHQALHRNAHDITRTLRAGESWRQDVRLAVAVPHLRGNILTLRHRDLDIAYVFRNGKVLRRAGPQAAWQEALNGVHSSRMHLDRGRDVLSCRWEIELTGSISKRVVTLRPLFTFQAVPQGTASATGSEEGRHEI
jgi:hypothetical protein